MVLVLTEFPSKNMLKYGANFNSNFVKNELKHGTGFNSNPITPSNIFLVNSELI